MKSWIETFSVSMKLPIQSNEEYIWDYLIHSYLSKDDELLKSFGATPLREYADIGLSLLKWFINNKTYLLEQDFKNFNGLLESILDIWCEEVKNTFENLTFEDKNHVFKGIFRMSRNMQTFVETYPFFQVQIEKLDQLRSSLEVIKYDVLNTKKIKNDLNKVTHWSEAVAVSIKLPIKTKIIQIIDYLVEQSSEELENFLEGIATIDIDLYPKIGETLLHYYLFKSREDPSKTFNGYEKLIATFTEFWFERIENIFSEITTMEQESLLAEMKKCDDILEDVLEELPVFEQCHKKMNELFEQLEPIEVEEENEQTRSIET